MLLPSTQIDVIVAYRLKLWLQFDDWLTYPHICFLFFCFRHPQEFSEEDYLAIVNGWREKLGRSKTGDQRWGLCHASKN